MQERFWLIFGLCGQAIFASRFLVQWIASERRKQSVIPLSFWWLSIAGSMMLLTYAIYQQDPVFIVGQTFGMLIYLRNLYLLKSHPERTG